MNKRGLWEKYRGKVTIFWDLVFGIAFTLIILLKYFERFDIHVIYYIIVLSAIFGLIIGHTIITITDFLLMSSQIMPSLNTTFMWITNKSESSYINWKRSGLLSVILGLIIGLLSLLVANSWGTFYESLLIMLLVIIITFGIQIQLDIYRFLYQEVEHNPIRCSLPEISEKIGQIPNLTIKNGSLDFIIDSIKQISKEGFVQLNVKLPDYTEYLVKLSRNAEKNIYGVNILRPKQIYELIIKERNIMRNYLRITRDCKCDKIRINALSKVQIKEIVQDAVESLTAKVGKREVIAGEFIPEIAWILKINGWQNSDEKMNTKNLIKPRKNKVLMLWTTHDLATKTKAINHIQPSRSSENEIDDYTIFDEQILVLYDYIPIIGHGTMKLQWDISENNRHSSTMVSEYYKPFQSIKKHIQKYNQIDKNSSLFLNFEDLVEGIVWDNENEKELIDLKYCDYEIKKEIESHSIKLNPRNVYGIMAKKKDWYFDSRYLFSWDDLSENNMGRLIKYLKKFKIEWAKTEKFDRIDENTINISDGTNYISLKINGEKTSITERTTIILKIKNENNDELILKKEGDNLNIYNSNKEIDYFECILE